VGNPIIPLKTQPQKYFFNYQDQELNMSFLELRHPLSETARSRMLSELGGLHGARLLGCSDLKYAHNLAEFVCGNNPAVTAFTLNAGDAEKPLSICFLEELGNGHSIIKCIGTQLPNLQPGYCRTICGLLEAVSKHLGNQGSTSILVKLPVDAVNLRQIYHRLGFHREVPTPPNATTMILDIRNIRPGF